MLFDSELRPLACWISSSGTVCGSRPFAAGRKNASAVPNSASITISSQMCTTPAKINAASRPCSAKRTRSVATITRWRGSRSAQTPPIKQERDQRQARRGEHEPEVGRAARQFDHEQRQRDDDDAVADHARGLCEPQVAEVAMAQHAQLGGQVAHAAQLDAGARGQTGTAVPRRAPRRSSA